MQRFYRVMDKADVIFEVIDARFPKETLSKSIECFAEEKGKKLVIVANKEDLISSRGREKVKEAAGNLKVIFVSAKGREGIASLRRLISSIAGKEEAKVGFVGYPNTGKSSIINALSGRHSALTSSQSGFTKGEQYINLSENVLLVDSPGVVGYEEKPEEVLALINAKSVDHLSDLESAALYIIKYIIAEKPDAIRGCYGVDARGRAEEILERVAAKRGFLLKGGSVDLNRAARLLITDWQKGKIKFFKK